MTDWENMTKLLLARIRAAAWDEGYRNMHAYAWNMPPESLRGGYCLAEDLSDNPYRALADDGAAPTATREPSPVAGCNLVACPACGARMNVLADDGKGG